MIKSEILVCSFFYCQRQNHKSVGMEKNAFSVPVDFVTFDPEGTTKKPKTPSPWLKKIQHIIQIYMLSHMNLIFRLRHIIKQKFKNQCTSKPASFNLKIRKSHWHVNILYIIYTDESGIFHCLGKAVTVTAIRRSTVLIYRILCLTGSPVQYNGNFLGLFQLKNPENLSELLWLKR